MANEFKAFDVYVYDSRLHNVTPDHSGHYLYLHFHSRTTVTHITLTPVTKDGLKIFFLHFDPPVNRIWAPVILAFLFL